jgi:hypothetical protein
MSDIAKQEEQPPTVEQEQEGGDQVPNDEVRPVNMQEADSVLTPCFV